MNTQVSTASVHCLQNQVFFLRFCFLFIQWIKLFLNFFLKTFQTFQTFYLLIIIYIYKTIMNYGNIFIIDQSENELL